MNIHDLYNVRYLLAVETDNICKKIIYKVMWAYYENIYKIARDPNLLQLRNNVKATINI